LKKAFLLSILFTIISIAISIYFKTLVASIFTKPELALFFTALDIVGLFMLLFIGFRASMTVAYTNGTDTAQILGVFRLAIAFVSIFGFLTSLVVVSYFGFALPVFYMFLLFVTFGFYTYFSNQLSMYRMYADINVVTLLDSIAAIFWFAAFYYAASIHTSDALFLSSIAGMLCIGGYIYFRKAKLHKEPSLSLPRLDEKTRTFIKNSIFGGMEFVFGMLIIYLAVLFVGYNFSLDILGDFQVVVKSFFMYFIAIFIFPIVKFILPELSLLVVKKEFGSIKKLNIFALRYAVASCIMVFLPCLFFADSLVVWLFGKSYILAADSLVVLSVAIFFVSMNTYQVALLKSLDKFFLSMSVRASGSFLFPFFAFLTHYFSPTLRSVSLALVLSYASMSAISYYFSKREVKKIST
jgi:O-antigen/teichoic acid export membrane protein